MITIEKLLTEAKKARASDLHVTVGVPPKIRVNGVLTSLDMERIAPSDVTMMIEPMLSEEQNKYLSEIGEIDFAYSLPGLGRYRTNIFRQRGSYALVMRLVDTVIPSCEQLHLPQSVIELTKRKKGLILVTGPAGCGKSTTMASLLNHINENYSYHIITLEDPIEFLHNHKMSVVNQREIGLDSLCYSNAIEAALREDPDVIFIGEIKDAETALLAINAAENGHLVFSTMHTKGAMATIERLVDFFLPHQQQQIRMQLALVLKAVVSQQLIPTIDRKQREPVFEVMQVNMAIKNLIRESKNHQIEAAIQSGSEMGMQLMDDAIYRLYRDKVIDPESAMQYAYDTFAMERKLF